MKHENAKRNGDCQGLPAHEVSKGNNGRGYLCFAQNLASLYPEPDDLKEVEFKENEII